MFLFVLGSCNCLVSTEREAGGSDCWSHHLILLSPLGKTRRQRSIELGQGAQVCFYIHSFFSLFVPAGICEFAPSPLSYMWKPQCSSAGAGPSAACLGRALEQPKHLPGWLRTCGFVQLAISLGVGRDAMVQLTPMLAGAGVQGCMTAEKLIWFFQRPWKPSVPYVVPSEQGDVLWFDLRPWGWCILTHLFVFGFWLFLFFFFIVPMTWACFHACHVLVDLRDW